MAHSGVGLWISLHSSSIICLYHTETFRHLQDIDMAPNVNRFLVKPVARSSIKVTSLMASQGLLWVGTNIGIALSIPLPRLEGVPIISGRANVSHHAHCGPITFFLNLQMCSKSPSAPVTPATPVSLPQRGTIQEESENETASGKSPVHSGRLPNISSRSSSSSSRSSSSSKSAAASFKTGAATERMNCPFPSSCL